METLYSQVMAAEKDLVDDKDALNWFNPSTVVFSNPLTPPPSEFLSTPSPGI